MNWILALSLILSAAAAAAPPAGYPYRIKGNVLNTSVQRVFPLEFTWNDTVSGYRSLWPDVAENLLPAAGGTLESDLIGGGWTLADGGTWDKGGWTHPSGGAAIYYPQELDYGYGTELEPTAICFLWGFATGVFLGTFAKLILGQLNIVKRTVRL